MNARPSDGETPESSGPPNHEQRPFTCSSASGGGSGGSGLGPNWISCPLTVRRTLPVIVMVMVAASGSGSGSGSGCGGATPVPDHSACSCSRVPVHELVSTWPVQPGHPLGSGPATPSEYCQSHTFWCQLSCVEHVLA